MKWAAKANLTGTALDKYKAYRAGSAETTYTRAADSLPGTLSILYLRPFGGDAGDIYMTQGSKRAIDKKDELIANGSLFQHKTKPTGNEQAKESDSFRPAKAIITKAGSGTTTKTSKVTGLPYKAKTGAATYTIPFGASGTEAATARYYPACLGIKESVEAKDPDYGVTFQPEYF